LGRFGEYLAPCGALALSAALVIGAPDASAPPPFESDDLDRGPAARFALRRQLEAPVPPSPRKKVMRVGLLGALGEQLVVPVEHAPAGPSTASISHETRTVVSNRRVALSIAAPDRFLAADLRQLLWDDGEAEQCAAARAAQPVEPLEVRVAPSGKVLSVSSDALELRCEREALGRHELPITPEGFTFRVRWSRRWP
jgi:hypothetical protein